MDYGQARHAVHAKQRAERLNGSAASTPEDRWPAPLAPEAFYGLAGEIVDELEPHTEAAAAALLVQLLVGFGSALGRGPYFVVEGDRHHTNLFAVVVGSSSSGRKGTSAGVILRRLLAPADPHWGSHCVTSGISSGEGLIYAVRDASERVIKRKKEVDPGVDDKRLLLLESEFASVLRRLEREGSSASAVLRQAWDHGDLRTLTKQAPVRATGAHISVIGHITPEELRRYLTRTESANGFANRHLFVCARRSKSLPEGGQLSDEVTVPLADRLRGALFEARKVGRMERDPEARELWASLYSDLTAERPGMLGAVTSRAAAQVLRLSMLYALLDRPSVVSVVSVVQRICVQHVAAASAVWNYCLASAERLFGSALGDPMADEILSSLCSSSKGLTRTEIRDLLGRNAPGDHVARALNLLLQRRKVRMEKENTGGRAAERRYACT